MKNFDKIILHDDEWNFAFRLACAIDALRSSHAYFIMQKAFGEIDWAECELKLSDIIGRCDCEKCEKVRKGIINRWRQ